MRSTPLTGKIRRLFAAAKAGHAGTLDEAASGIMAIALGEATKTVPYLMAQKKRYRFRLQWGAATDTHDRLGNIIARSPHTPAAQDITALLPQFCGRIVQTPPDFSAVKLAGRRAWQYARGENPESAPKPQPRFVDIFELRLLSHSPEERCSELEVLTGKGVYIRALARDMAAKLDIPAHISLLTRLSLGPFTLAQASLPETLAALAAQAPGGEPASFAALDQLLHPLTTALGEMPQIRLSPAEAEALRQGRPVFFQANHAECDILLDRRCVMGENKEHGEAVMLALCRDRPIGLVRLEGEALKPCRRFNWEAMRFPPHFCPAIH